MRSSRAQGISSDGLRGNRCAIANPFRPLHAAPRFPPATFSGRCRARDRGPRQGRGVRGPRGCASGRFVPVQEAGPGRASDGADRSMRPEKDRRRDEGAQWLAARDATAPDLPRGSGYRLHSMIVQAMVDGIGVADGHSLPIESGPGNRAPAGPRHQSRWSRSSWSLSLRTRATGPACAGFGTVLGPRRDGSIG